MKTAEIRSRFLKYFESKGHQIVESSSLVPSNDPTLLFTAAGMVQFKDVFLGKDPRPYTRATTAQKCVRAGGKHNDLENVGFTARHHTFFEMLGNFSFGDYFKKEAISFAWEFVTKELKLPVDRVYVTVFEKDDEAEKIWHEQEGVPMNRIYRLGEKDNFWAAGDTGPCGPCSEIYFDRGPKYGQDDFLKSQAANEDRFMEFWNLVFMQYDRDASGKLSPLPRPSVDTGAGIERIASILQEVDTNYDIDTFQTIIQKTATLAGVAYEPSKETAVSFRVVADHARAATFLIGDGVLPSNEGRGYVLRRIMRRAIRHGKKLGFEKPFLNQVAQFVIDEMSVAYPDLLDKRSFIERAILAEEEQFLRTLAKGLELLEEESSKVVKGKALPGAVAFKLYDTYGFPLDLTRVILDEKRIALDEKGFEESMAAQRAESRKSWKGSGEQAIDAIYMEIAKRLKASNELPVFDGFEKFDQESKLVALLEVTDSGLKEVKSSEAPAFAAADGSDAKIVEAVFAKTPFYGEGGGQVGDKGQVTSKSGFAADVIDAQKPVPDLTVLSLRLTKGTITLGESYHQSVNSEIRMATTRNHTATHLLHWALRKKLGTHVKQAGSTVTPDLLRFDFSHFEPLKPSEIREIEDEINQKIWKNDGVKKVIMHKDEAVKAGAIAFFGEKYGDQVRVVSVGDFSTELCGGCHVDQSGDIHLFKIVSEAGIASGVRRIIAKTGHGAFEYLREQADLLATSRDLLKAQSVEDTPEKIERLIAAEREGRRQIEQLKARETSQAFDAMLSSAQEVGGVKLVSATINVTEGAQAKLRELGDALKSKAPNAIGIFLAHEGGKTQLAVAAGSDAQKKFGAQVVLKELLPLIEGRGGGKPDFAQAGGTKPANLSDIIAVAVKMFTKTA